MIDVHYWPSPNVWKVTIMLEECGSSSGCGGRAEAGDL
jgi:glutathione S-transferase